MVFDASKNASKLCNILIFSMLNTIEYMILSDPLFDDYGIEEQQHCHCHCQSFQEHLEEGEIHG
jgi:hypothetical protein